MKPENEQFFQEADVLLKDRLKQFHYYTSITPADNDRKHDLQWYLNTRNRAKTAFWQKVRELDVEDVGVSNYSEWADSRLDEESDSSYAGPVQANPDLLSESSGPNEPFTGVQVHTARKLINKSHEFLTPQEFLVFQMRFVEGLTPSEIAGRMNINYKTVQTYLTRLISKTRKVFRNNEQS
jgi:RNA polymerase sigma factor (sigma-70 family)